MYILHSRKTKLSLRVYAAIVSYIMYVYIYICYSPMYIYTICWYCIVSRIV